jgi:asparagine synthase (glutamine-hydrolysing)
MLSGGVDSGSVVAVASELLHARGAGSLPTYSATRHRDADCAESRAVHAAINLPGIDPMRIYPETAQETASQLIAGNEEPFDGRLLILKAVYAAAHAQGKTVVLDGAGGDVVLGEGSYITRLIRRGRLATALKEIRGEALFWGEDSRAQDYLGYAARALLPGSVSKSLRRLRRSRRVEQYLETSLISRDFAESVDIGARCDQLWKLTSDAWTPDFALERSRAIRPNMTAGRERYARLGASHAVEARDPFLDKRVVDYCTRLPGHLLMAAGWRKMLLREIMVNRLPGEVTWCRGKPHLGWLFNEAVTRIMVDRDQYGLSPLQDTLRDFIAPATLEATWHRFASGGDAEQIHSALILETWLRENETRPVVRG